MAESPSVSYLPTRRIIDLHEKAVLGVIKELKRFPVWEFKCFDDVVRGIRGTNLVRAWRVQRVPHFRLRDAEAYWGRPPRLNILCALPGYGDRVRAPRKRTDTHNVA